MKDEPKNSVEFLLHFFSVFKILSYNCVDIKKTNTNSVVLKELNSRVGLTKPG